MTSGAVTVVRVTVVDEHTPHVFDPDPSNDGGIVGDAPALASNETGTMRPSETMTSIPITDASLVCFGFIGRTPCRRYFASEVLAGVARET
jgi:hypothetical protein